jgi:hypothetical protein
MKRGRRGEKEGAPEAELRKDVAKGRRGRRGASSAGKRAPSRSDVLRDALGPDPPPELADATADGTAPPPARPGGDALLQDMTWVHGRRR